MNELPTGIQPTPPPIQPAPGLLHGSPPPITGSFRILWFAFTLITILGVSLGRGFKDNAIALWQVLPLITIGMLAYLGEHRPLAAVFAWLGAAGLLILTGLSMLGWVAQELIPNNASSGVEHILPFLPLALLLCLGLATAGFAWLPCFGRAADPGSRMRTRLAATVCIGMSGMLVAPLIFQGRPPLLNPTVLGSMTESLSNADMVIMEVVSGIWMIIGTFCLVGFTTKRSFAESVVRLGLVRPTRKMVALAVGAGVVFFIINAGLSMGIDFLWAVFHFTTTDEGALQELFGDINSPVTVLAMSVGAGVTEELAIRGVLQPRLGLLTANIFFMSLHALQYNWDGLIVVFMAGVGLGLLRKRYNTTVCMMTHAIYDILAFTCALLFSTHT